MDNPFLSRRSNLHLALKSAQNEKNTLRSAESNNLTSPLLSNIPTLILSVLGISDSHRIMKLSEIQDLGDIFSKNILLNHSNPQTLAELINSLESIRGHDELIDRQIFLVAEGAQFKLSHPDFFLNARFVFTWKRKSGGQVDVMLSTIDSLHSNDSLLQLIAWSDADDAFHYFERKSGFWGWAGSSFHSLHAPTRGKGPFDSHVNGALVMKELKFPWAHWHSQSNSIPREAFPTISDFRSDPIFATINTAEDLEEIVKAGVRRFINTRVKNDFATSGGKNIITYTRQIVSSTTANLVSSSTEFHKASNVEIDIPLTFFLDAQTIESAAFELDVFMDVMPAGNISVNGRDYVDAARELLMYVPSELTELRVEGDTHFCFVVPERSIEDIFVCEHLMSKKLIEPKLLMCLLMVDFPNPICSERRRALGKYFPETVQPAISIGEVFLRNILHSNHHDGSPESEFLTYWNADNILAMVKHDVQMFVDGIRETLSTKEGIAKLIILSEQRKRSYRARDLDEFRSTTSKLGFQIEDIHISKTGFIESRMV